MTHRHKVHVMRRRQARETTRLRERAATKPGITLERRWLRAPVDGPLEDERGVVYLPERSAADETDAPPPAAA
ncbi:MAG TPA: hypothetical protein VMW35_12625 [Myxococcota bacterium]|jgi:hypothetical protein|nr:hypothetical protein [Myxococcota bacterium]